MIYEPAEDSYLLKEQITKYAKGKDYLDLGSGSGILAESAIPTAKSVTASDINPEAIKHLKNKFKDKVRVIESNLFSKIKGKFDLISFNPPYLPMDSREDKESRLATTGGKKGDETILVFLKQAKNHIKENSIILILLSSLTPRTRIISLLSKLGFKHKVIASQDLFQEKLEVLEIKHNNQ